MLAEIFMLRMEAVLRAVHGPSPGNSDTRFIPIELPDSSTEDGPRQPVDSDNLMLNRAA